MPLKIPALFKKIKNLYEPRREIYETKKDLASNTLGELILVGNNFGGFGGFIENLPKVRQNLFPPNITSL